MNITLSPGKFDGSRGQWTPLGSRHVRSGEPARWIASINSSALGCEGWSLEIGLAGLAELPGRETEFLEREMAMHRVENW